MQRTTSRRRAAEVVAVAMLLLDLSCTGPVQAAESVALPLSFKEGTPFPNLIDISVGGGAMTPVTFDVGSTGLYILASEVGSNAQLSSTPFIQKYEDKTEFKGFVGTANVSFRTATGQVTTVPIPVGVIEDYTCGPTVPDCLTGRSGVMGARYYQYFLSEGPNQGVPTGLFNPLAFLPGNLASGYMVAATGPTPSIIVGLTDNNIRGFASTPLQPMDPNSPIPQSPPPGRGAWEIKSIEACYRVGHHAEECAVTSFDTGESDAQFTAPVSVPPGTVPNNTKVTIRIPGVGITYTFIAGDTNWVDKFEVLTMTEGTPAGFNSGAQFYNTFAVAYDYFNGIGYFSPITTWITGTYRPASDSDLGSPGAIALAGTLELPPGFSSARPIFIGNDSTITSLGESVLFGTLSGGAALTLTGPGALTLAGESVNTGPIYVNHTTLNMAGSTLAPVVLSNALLSGTGSVGALSALSGGIVAPGNSIGTLSVDGDVTFARGSTYLAEIGAPGRSDKITAGGAAAIDGARILVVPDDTYVPGFERFTVLTADKGVDGKFSVEAPDFGTRTATFPFLGVEAVHASDRVFVDVGRSDVSFTAAATTRNQRAAAFGADQLDERSALLEALARLNFTSAPAALDAVSGEIYASAQTAMIENASFTRDVILDRLYQVAADGGEPVSAWAQGYGGFGEKDGNGNAATVDRSGGGMIAGADARLEDGWRAGFVAGGGASNFAVDARRSSGSAESFTVGAYAGGQPWQDGATLNFGTAYAWLDVDATRHVAFSGFSDTVSGAYDGGVFQVFGEAAYSVPVGKITGGQTALEPFLGVSFFGIHTGDFHERGGAAALAGRSDDFSSTVSTLGLRGVTRLALSDRLELDLHGAAAWQHAFGTREPDAALAFAGQATPFVVYGVPLAEDSLRLNVGAQAEIGPQAQVGFAYQGAFARDLQENAFRGELSMRF